MGVLGAVITLFVIGVPNTGVGLTGAAWTCCDAVCTLAGAERVTKGLCCLTTDEARPWASLL